MAFSVEKLDDTLHVTLFHNVAVFMFTGTVRANQFARVIPVLEELAGRFPQGIVATSMTAPGLPAPSLELRTPTRELFARFGDRLALVMPIIDDTGIFAAARRAFVRGIILLLNRPNFDMAASVDEAARRIAPHARRSDGGAVGERDLHAMLRFCADHLGA